MNSMIITSVSELMQISLTVEIAWFASRLFFTYDLSENPKEFAK